MPQPAFDMQKYLLEDRQKELTDLLFVDKDWWKEYSGLLEHKAFLLSDDYEELFAMLAEVNARKCREDINRFLQYCVLDPQTLQPIKQAPLHLELQKLLDDFNRLIILFPREHGKTTQIIWRAIWELGNNVEHRIKIVCASDALAIKRVTAIREAIQNNKRVKLIFPNLTAHTSEDTWSKTRFTVQRTVTSPDPSLEGAGILSSATGGRASLLICDDPVDMKNAITQPALRPQVKRAFRDVWINLLFSDAKVWYIATTWHEDDLTYDLKKEKEVWRVMEYPIKDNYKPVWKEQWPTKRLKSREKEIGKKAFARGFKLMPVSDEDMTFPDIFSCRNYKLSVADVLKENPHATKYMGVDLAISKRKESAYTVIFNTLLAQDGKRYPIEVIRGKFSSIATAVLVLTYGAKWNSEVIKIENNAYQDSILEWIELLQESLLKNVIETIKKFTAVHGAIKNLNDEKKKLLREQLEEHFTIIKNKIMGELSQAQWDDVNKWLPIAASSALPLQPHYTGTQKADDILGLPNLSAEVSNGDWIFPMKNCKDKDHDSETCGFCLLIEEARFHPNSKYQDIIMAWWMSREGIRSGSGSVRMF